MPIIVDAIEYDRLRRDVGTTDAVLNDIMAQAYLDEASERYPEDTAKTLMYSRVLVLRGIRASAALLGKYAQGQSTEDLTKVFDHLTTMMNEYSEEVNLVSDPIETGVEPFFFGVAVGRRGVW